MATNELRQQARRQGPTTHKVNERRTEFMTASALLYTDLNGNTVTVPFTTVSGTETATPTPDVGIPNPQTAFSKVVMTGIIVGAVLGTVLLLSVIGAFWFFCKRRRSKSQTPHSPASNEYPMPYTSSVNSTRPDMAKAFLVPVFTTPSSLNPRSDQDINNNGFNTRIHTDARHQRSDIVNPGGATQANDGENATGGEAMSLSVPGQATENVPIVNLDRLEVSTSIQVLNEETDERSRLMEIDVDAVEPPPKYTM